MSTFRAFLKRGILLPSALRTIRRGHPSANRSKPKTYLKYVLVGGEQAPPLRALFGHYAKKEFNMKTFSAIALAAVMGVSAVTLASTNASAAIVCNQDGDCWHTQAEYAYQPSFGLSVHQNDWKWKEGEKHAWREHEGKGYWKGSNWTSF